jgi:hypothetical protein
MKLVISLATRGRPQQVVETIARSLPNLILPNTVMMVQVDADDEPTVNALSRPPWDDERVQINIAPREDTIAAKWNRATAIAADVYLVAADDDPYITPGYDAKILEAAKLFPDGIGMVYGHMANASFSGAVAPTAKFVEKLGHIFPPYFPYWFVDHWTDDVAKIIGRISFADVRTDQSKVGKTQELREPAWWATFFDAAYLMRRQIAHTIIGAADFHEPAWRRKLLLAHHPLIEYRSRWVNDSVRAGARQLEGWSGLDTHDARYQRVRQAAVAMLPHLLDDYGMDRDEAAKFRNALTPPTQVVGLKRAFA